MLPWQIARLKSWRDGVSLHPILRSCGAYNLWFQRIQRTTEEKDFKGLHTVLSRKHTYHGSHGVGNETS